MYSGELLLNGIESREHFDFALRAITYVRTYWPVFIKISLICNDLSLLNKHCDYFTKNNVLIRCSATNANLALYADNPSLYNQCFFHFDLTNENFSDIPVISSQIFLLKLQSRFILIVNEILEQSAYNCVKKCCLIQHGFMMSIKLAASEFLTWEMQGAIDSNSQLQQSSQVGVIQDVDSDYEGPIHFKFSSHRQNNLEYNRRMNAVNLLKENAWKEND